MAIFALQGGGRDCVADTRITPSAQGLRGDAGLPGADTSLNSLAFSREKSLLEQQSI